MSKPNAALAVLSALALCLPAAAATISANEVSISLGGSAELVGENRYSVLPGTVATIKMASNPGDIVWLFAVVDDQWGEADYGNILTLFLDKAGDTGLFEGAFWVPAELAGKVFHLQAVSVDSKGEFHGSAMVDVVIPDVLILLPPPQQPGLPTSMLREAQN